MNKFERFKPFLEFCRNMYNDYILYSLIVAITISLLGEMGYLK